MIRSNCAAIWSSEVCSVRRDIGEMPTFDRDDVGTVPLFTTYHREHLGAPAVLRGMTRLGSCTIVFVALLAGCGSKAAKKQSVPTPSAPAASAQTTPAPVQAQPISPNVAVSDDLAKRCSLKFANAEQAPKFGYNEDDLLPADRDVLQQVAECLTKGPLQGRSVQLVGRADPRGTEEYNLGLGTRRAETVRSYLQRLGVPSSRLAPTTRGELDASGSDESSWQRDRRVDLQLVN
jgi:peptidoglycan-associated lipoprotein